VRIAAAARDAAQKDRSTNGTNPYGHKYFGTGTNSGAPVDIDWGQQRKAPRSLPISGVPRPRFHAKGGDGTRRHWGSEPEPQTSNEIGSFFAKPDLYRDIDYDGLADANEAASMASVRAAAKPPVMGAEMTKDTRDAALLRSINGRRDKWGEEMYSVVNLEDSGYLL